MKILSTLLLCAALGWAQNPPGGKGLVFTGQISALALSSDNFAGYGGIAAGAPEITRQAAIPVACRSTAFTVTSISTQSATGSMVMTLRKNGVDTASVITIPANGPAGVYSDMTHAVAWAPGDLFSVHNVNNATQVSTTVVAFAVVCQ
jgi:hypothetical protein